MSNPRPGGPVFVFRVFSPRWVSFSTLIEALLPLVLFQGFSSLGLWAITLMGEANLVFQFWKYSILQWTGLRMAKRGRDRNMNSVTYC